MTGNNCEFAPPVDPRGVGQGGFRADVHHVRALGGQDPAAPDCGFRRQADAFAIPGIGEKD